MWFSNEVQQYLQGTRFSTALHASYQDRNTSVIDRLAFLPEKCRGQEHPAHWLDRPSEGDRKQNQAPTVAAFPVVRDGIDIKREAVEFCRVTLGRRERPCARRDRGPCP